MGRMSKPELAPPRFVVIASAAPAKVAKDYIKFSRQDSGWQSEAWGFYDSVPELRYAADWVGNLLSQALLIAMERIKGSPKSTKNAIALDALERFFTDPDGRAEMLRLVGINFTIAGDCWIIGSNVDGKDVWQVVAATEVGYKAGVKGSSGRYSANGLSIPGKDHVGIRIWRPHARNTNLSHSPLRALLGVLGVIEGLSKHSSAQVDSRLAGAGILLLPAEMQLPPAPVTEGVIPATRDVASEFSARLQEAMSAALTDRGSAASLVPITVTAPGDQIGNARHITFWSPLDENLPAHLDQEIRRLALGLDMPPEVLLGMADVNHWSAWQADESSIKAHTEPLLKVVTHAITVGYLRPVLEAQKVENPTAFSIAADTSHMRRRPNRSKEAAELYDRGELTGEALRRENGFEETDAPNDEQVKAWFTRKVASGSTTPELVAAALARLGIDLPVMLPAEPTRQARPTPSLLEHPVTGPPELPVGDGLAAAADGIVVRALERAGNRIRNRLQARIPGATAMTVYRFVTTKPNELDFLLEDAWAHVPEVAERYGVDVSWLEAALNAYCRILLTDKRPHHFATLHDYLSLALTEQPKEVAA